MRRIIGQRRVLLGEDLEQPGRRGPARGEADPAVEIHPRAWRWAPVAVLLRHARPPLWPARATAPVVAGAQAATAKVTEDGRGKGEVEEDDRWGQGQIRLFTSSPSQK